MYQDIALESKFYYLIGHLSPALCPAIAEQVIEESFIISTSKLIFYKEKPIEFLTSCRSFKCLDFSQN